MQHTGLALLLFILLDVGANGQALEPLSSIRGVVRDTEGRPVQGVSVRASSASKRATARTSTDGSFTLDDLPSGTYRVSASHDSPVVEMKSVTIAPGENLNSLDFRLQELASVGGQVVDENNDPAVGVKVFLIGTEYQHGELRYTFRDVATTDDRGAYLLQRAVPGLPYAVLAKPFASTLPAVSEVPDDPDRRRQIMIPTYYPRADSIESAERIRLRSSESRDQVNIRLLTSHSYCLDGILGAFGTPAQMQFSVAELQPSSGFFSGGGMYERPAMGVSRTDGTFRVCDLHRGEYRITANAPGAASLNSYGTAIVSIAREDVHDFRVNSMPRMRVEGEVTWSSTPPQDFEMPEINVVLEPIYRVKFIGESLRLTSKVPGEFSFEALLVDDYEVRIQNLPRQIYIKDILYAGRSITHDALRLGSEARGARLRIVLGSDSASIEATVVDDDGQPRTDSSVVIVPEDAQSPSNLVEQMFYGQTDQYGHYLKSGLAPGKYYVLATSIRPTPTPDFASQLLSGRHKGKVVELGSRAQTQVTLAGDAF